MTPEEIESAVEDMAKHLAETECMFPISGPEFEKGRYRVGTMSPIKAAPVVKQKIGGGYDLVCDENGNSTPAFRVPGSLGEPDYHLVYNDGKGVEVIARARDGDALAKSLLLEIAAVYVASGCVMPERLRDYIVEKLQTETSSGPERRGRPPHVNEARNFHISMAINAAARKYELRPTRNRASETESACSIVTQALERRGAHFSESAVEKIWQEFSQKYPDFF